jgi:hypothetical protein
VELHQRTLSWREILDYCFKTEDSLGEFSQNIWMAAPVTAHNIYVHTGNVVPDLPFSLPKPLDPTDPHQQKAIRPSNNPVPKETQMANMRQYFDQTRANSRERQMAFNRIKNEQADQHQQEQQRPQSPTFQQQVQQTQGQQQEPRQFQRSPFRYQQRSDSPRRFNNPGQYNPGNSDRQSRNDQWQQQQQQSQFQQQVPQQFNFQTQQQSQPQQAQPMDQQQQYNSRQSNPQQQGVNPQQSRGQNNYQPRDASRGRTWYNNYNQGNNQSRSRNSSPDTSRTPRKLVPGQHVRPAFDPSIHKECIKCPAVRNMDGSWNRETSHNDADCVTYVFYNRLGCHLCKKLNLGDAFHFPIYCKNWGNVAIKGMDVAPYLPLDQGNI